MAYEATMWQDNDLITAEKLNKLEQGVKNEQVGPAGEQGPAGTPGAAAGFGTPTATAEAVENSAQPEVTVEASGDNTAKVFTFHFKIPKGADGADGQDGESPSPATTETAGVVKQIANIPDLAEAPTQENFNALLAALKTAGIMAEA